VRKKGDWIAPLVYLAIFVAGAYIVYVAIAGLTGGATHPKRETTYEVQYAFNVGAQTYTYRDPTGRTNLWVSLTREAWDAARANGTTPVRYLPSDPWTSRAVHAAGDPVESNVIGLVVGLILMLPATLWLVRLVRRRRVATA